MPKARRSSWTAPGCPLSPDLFVDLRGVVWQFGRKQIGGEGWGEGGLFARCHPRKPLIRPVGHLLPRFRGRRASFDAASYCDNMLSVISTHHSGRCSGRVVLTIGSPFPGRMNWKPLERQGNAFVESECFVDQRTAGTPLWSHLVCLRVACHTLRPDAF